MTSGFVLVSADYHKLTQQMFYNYYLNKQFVDVTLACEGAEMEVHSVVIAAGCKYFEVIFI